jgi:hypothetical protein
MSLARESLKFWKRGKRPRSKFGELETVSAFEGTEPSIKSEYPFENWFAESLEVAKH